MIRIAISGFTEASPLLLTEITWFAHRPFWLLAWSGVFERHPSLRFVMTEQGATWIPDTLREIDQFYEMPMFRHLRRAVPLSPENAQELDQFKNWFQAWAPAVQKECSALAQKVGSKA